MQARVPRTCLSPRQVPSPLCLAWICHPALHLLRSSADGLQVSAYYAQQVPPRPPRPYVE
jgi:hypothetical protein